MKMPTILFVDTSPKPGKAVSRLALILDSLIEAKATAHLFCSRPDFFKATMKNPIPTHTLDWPGFTDVTGPESGFDKRGLFKGISQGRALSKFSQKIEPEFSKLLESVGPDLVHISGIGLPQRAFADLCKETKIPYIAHAHDAREYTQKEGAMLEAAGKVLVCGKGLREYLGEQFPEVFYRRFETFLWPVDTDRFNTGPDLALREKYETAADSKVVLCTAPLAENEGQLDLIEAMEIVKEQEFDSTLWLSKQGDSSFLEQVKSKAEELGVAVRFVDEPPDSLKLLAAVDLLILAPRFARPEFGPVSDNGDLAAMGMAAGLPVVVTEAGCAPDIVLGSGGGAVVPPESPKDLASAISAYLSKPALWEKASAAARQRIQSGISPDAAANRLLAIYQDALSVV